MNSPLVLSKGYGGWPTGDLCQFSLTNEKPSAHVLCQYVIQSSQRGAGLAQGYLRINFNVWRKENLANLAFYFLLDCSSSSLPLHLEEDVETVLQRLFCESRKGRNRSRPPPNPHSNFIPPSSPELAGNFTLTKHSVPWLSHTRSFQKVKSPVPINRRASRTSTAC